MMKRRLMWLAATAATVLCAGAALASAVPAPSSTPASEFSAFAVPVEPLVAEPVLAVSTSSGANVPEISAATQFEAIRYRPRRYRERYRERSSGYGTLSQFHAGFMDPSNDLGTGFLAGFRIGPMVDPHIQVGVGVDWWHRSENQTVSVGSEEPGPGGIPVVRERQLSETTANMFPVYGFIQVGGHADADFIPYVGASAGYQALFLDGEDDLGEFDATYGGFGWQVWGGAALRLGGPTRLSGEAFWNGAELGRDAEDEFGQFREIVDMDGFGMRFGLSWGF